MRRHIFTARCYASAVLVMALCLSVCLHPSVCLSVCPSQVSVLLKRLNVGSHEQHHTIAHGLIDYVLLPLQPDHYKQHSTKNDQSQNVVRHIALTCAVPATKVIRHLPCLSYRRRRHWELMHSEVMSLLFTELFARALYQGLHN